MDFVASSNFVGEQLFGDLECIPFCVLHPGLHGGDDVDRHRDDVVAKSKAAARWDLYRGDFADKGGC